MNFVRWLGIKSIALRGKGASATVESAAEDMAKLRDRLREFDVDCIHNVDETGLFYKLLPETVLGKAGRELENAPRYS